MSEHRWQQWLLDTADSQAQARLLDLSHSSRWFIWLLAVFLFSLIVWASVTEIDEVVTGQGRIIPDSRIQQVQSLDGGILKSIFVREGERVNAGDTLLQIDETRFLSGLLMNKIELDSARWEVARLEAELDSISSHEPVSITGHHQEEDWRITPVYISLPESTEQFELVNQHNEILEKRLQSLVSQLEVLARQKEQKNHELLEQRQKIRTLSRSVQLINEELEIKAPLADEGLVTRIDLINLQKRANEQAGELANARLMESRSLSACKEADSRYNGLIIRHRSDVQKELQLAREKLDKLTEGHPGFEDRVQRTTLSAPVRGLVKAVLLNTPGSVVQPGATLVEIVPTADTLVVEARVQPSDVAFLRPGQDVRIKITAYENASYGNITGKLSSISADTHANEQGQDYYRIRVAIPESNELPGLLSGMTSVVDIVTGKRSVMSFLLAPVLN